ncbi:MAG: hypothetical protein JO352_02870 [Chloroflexi bacterium]|nr:hypothetical protein [Chloroflexota bacterium]
MLDLETALAILEAALLDADARLSTTIGDRYEVTTARLWRGQVLVDWEPDAQAGDCLLRPDLLRRLAGLHAQVRIAGEEVLLHAPGRIVAALSSDHAALVRRLGGARRIELALRLRFVGNVYAGGEETYSLIERGRRVPLLRLVADVKVRTPHTASPRTSPAPR